MLKTSSLYLPAGIHKPVKNEARAPFSRSASGVPQRLIDISSDRMTAGITWRAASDSAEIVQPDRTLGTPVRELATAKVDGAAVRMELTRILNSKTFSRAAQMSSLLEWIVGHWLAGETNQLDGQHILTAVFCHKKPLRASLDSTGRVYMGRLRAQLERYYEGEGAASHVRLEIPIGQYIPSFCSRKPSCENQRTMDQQPRKTVMVLPFRDAGNADPSTGPNPLAITDHLISQLTRSRALQVMSRASALRFDQERDARVCGQHSDPHFIVEGTVSRSVDTCELTVHLSETKHGYNLWTRHYPLMTIHLASVSKRVVHDLLRRIRDNHKVAN